MALPRLSFAIGRARGNFSTLLTAATLNHRFERTQVAIASFGPR